MPVVRNYRPDERPDVEVPVDGEWWKGELRQWSKDADDNWWAQGAVAPHGRRDIHRHVSR